MMFTTQYPGTLGDASQQGQLQEQSPQHQLGNADRLSSATGAGQPRGGQNPGNAAGRAARNSATVGASDAVEDINASASPPAMDSLENLYGCPDCEECRKKFPPLLARWTQSEANPQCNRGPRDPQVSPTWSGLAETMDTVPRYYYGGALHVATPSNIHDIISHEGVVLGEKTAAVCVSLYSADASSIVAYLVREWNLRSNTQTDWLHVLDSALDSTPTNNKQRRQGYLFYDLLSDTYTVATSQGLLLCTRANAPTPTCCNWVNSYGNIPPESSVSVAGGFALQGAFHEYDAAVGTPSDCAVDCYVRGATEWAWGAQVVLGNKLTGCDFVEACGKWDPYQSGSYWEGQENTRWPYLAASQEWLVWIAGTAGDRNAYKGVTAAKAALVAIKASTGAVRVVEAYDAPLIKVMAFEEALADAEERLTYQSSLHPENWIPTGYPSFGYDGGGAHGWGGGHLAPGAVGAGTFSWTTATYPDLPALVYDGGDIPAADLGYGHWNYEWQDRLNGLGETYHELVQTTWSPGAVPDVKDYEGAIGGGRATQYLDVYAGWTTDTDPTVAGKSQRLINPFPRGIVDNDGRVYEFVRHSQWQAADGVGYTPSTPYYEPSGYPWTYGGFEDFASTGLSGGITRVYKRVRSVQGLFGYGSDFDRLILRQYSASGLLATLDLTREFPYVDEADKHRTTYQRPDVIDWVVAGDYLWVAASDWFAADDQRLALILINKDTLLEVDRIDLSPGEGRLCLIETDIWGSGGRPQIWGGVDATGEPWVQVEAWFLDSTESVIQELRYVSSALTKETLASNASRDGTNQPSRLTAVANVALSPGYQFWLDNGRDLKRLNS